MSGQYIMVSFRRRHQRLKLVSDGLPLVHYDRRDSGRRAVFKLASLSFFPFGKGSDLRRRRRLTHIEYYLACGVGPAAGAGTSWQSGLFYVSP